MAQEKEIKSTCGMCFAACGVLIQVKDGKVIKVKGDPLSPINHGVLCPKGRAAPKLLYHPDRLKHPLKRIGAKGGRQWSPISWDEALDTIADEFTKNRDCHGPESVAFIQGSAKGLIDNYNERLANAFGTPNFATTGHVCFLPRLFASQMTCGSYTVADYEHPPACILVWGANLAETRIGEHHRTIRQLGKGTKLIVVDPVQSVLAKKSHIWLQLRPGTDLALALGILHVIINEKIYDHTFVEQYTLGLEQLKDHLKPYNPQAVAKITWVPVDKIEKAAGYYAKIKPACLQWGNAVDHGINSFQTARALAILKAIVGSLDIPGGDVLPSYPLVGPGAPDITLRDMVKPEAWQRRVGADQERLPQFYRILPRNLVDAIITEKPYPIQSVYVHASNPLVTYTNTSQAYRAFMKLNFMAVSDFFMTPTAALADIVLPASTFFEYDSIVAPPYYPFAQIQQKVVHFDDCRSDFEIAAQLASRLGHQDLFWEDSHEMFDEVLTPTGMTYEQFKEKGIISGTTHYRKYEKSGFATPSGKVEFFSNRLSSWGFDPLPVYREPPETPLSDPELAAKYPLVLTTKKSIYYLHSGGRQIDILRQKHPEPILLIHPATAARDSIENGDWVYLETERGRIKQKAIHSDKVDPRVVCADFGWWFPEKGIADLFGWSDSNVNMLTDDQKQNNPETGSENLRGMLCRVRLVD